MKRQTLRCCGTYEVGGGYPDEVLGVKGKNGTARELGSSKLENAEYRALLRGGEQVISVLEEMIVLVHQKLVSHFHFTFTYTLILMWIWTTLMELSDEHTLPFQFYQVICITTFYHFSTFMSLGEKI
ncbi:hypothetical protein ACFX2A_036208 [Malus domestica]